MLSGRTVIEYSIERFNSHPSIDEVCVVIHPEWRERMNKRWLISIIVILVSLLPEPLSAQRMTTMGKDFWVCFLNNNSDLYTGTKHKIFVSGINNCSVTVSNPRIGWSTTQNIIHGEVATFDIPMEQCENTESEVVVNKGIHVTSTGMGINGNGDLSMLNITPIERMISNVTFSSYSTPSTSNHRVNVMLRTADIGLFTLDGAPYPNSFSPIQSDMTYSSAIFTVSQGSHTLNMGGEGNGFVAHAFGLGERESYAYSVESNLKDLDNALYVNGQYVPCGDNVTGCVGDTYKGEKCKRETYVYLIEYRTKTMPLVVQERVGTIMLLR